jgi:putative ABC transport system permease protein
MASRLSAEGGAESVEAASGVRLALAARLLIRDWRSGEIIVLLTALTVAVAAMGAVALFTDRVRQAVAQQASEALAADLRVGSVVPLAETYEREAQAGGLSTARVTRFRSVVTNGDASSLADVRGVSAAYPLRGEVRVARALAAAPETAHGIPGRGEAWIEPSLLARLGLGVGDEIRVGRLSLRVTRTLEFRPDEGWRLMQLAPTILMNLDDLAATGLLQPGSVAEYDLLFAGPEGRVTAFRRELEQRLPPEDELQDYRDARPEVRASVTRAERFLILSAMVSVLLGGVAVAMGARRFVARRLDATALMKCLGAQHSDVLRLSVAQLLLLVSVAALVGSALGYLAQFGLSFIAADLVEARLPPPGLRGMALGPLTAVAVACGFALPALLQLRHVPPARVLRRDLAPPRPGYWLIYGAAALAVAGILYVLFEDFELTAYLMGGTAVVFATLYGAGRALVALLQQVRGTAGVAWRFGVANVARRGRESSVQVVAFGIGLMVLLLLTTVRTQLMTQWQATLPPESPNHFAINVQPAERETVQSVLEEHGIAAPPFTPLVRARISHVNGQPVRDFPAKDEHARHELNDDVNLTWTAELSPDNEIVAGQWWEQGDTTAQVSIAEDKLEELGLGLGDELTYAVAGESVTTKITSVRRIHWDSFRPNFFMVVNPGTLDDFPHTYVTSFYVPEQERAVTIDLARTLPSVSVIDIGAVLDQVRSGMNRAALAVQYVFMFTFAAGVMVLLAAIQATREERMYESAVLRTLGASRRVVLKSVAAEFAAIGLLAGSLAAAGAALTGYLLARHVFEVEYVPGVGIWIAGVVAGVAIVGVSGMLAVRSVVDAPPVSVLRRI